MMRLIFALGLLSVLAACKQDEVLKTVEDNRPPPDGAVPTVTVENFVSRSYISLIGRKPDATENAAALATLNAGGFSVAARKAFLLNLMADSAYVRRLYDAANLELLRGIDTAEVVQRKLWLEEVIANPYEDWMKFNLGQFKYELERNKALLAADDGLFNRSLTVRDFHTRMVNNEIYDEINMGTANFVLSLFESFLFRNPTEHEYEQATRMVDGKNAVLFLRSGNSKENFLSLFFDSDDYIAGQITQLFTTHLLRKPDAAEMEYHVKKMRNSGFDFQAAEAEIMSGDEFSGLKK